MKTKAEVDFRAAVDQAIKENERLVDQLLGMIGERDRRILELEAKLREKERE